MARNVYRKQAKVCCNFIMTGCWVVNGNDNTISQNLKKGFKYLKRKYFPRMMMRKIVLVGYMVFFQ